ncbi:MAG TPA: thiamine pyrophosphate-binding protein [Actinomycetota bacterium]|nr:thiamine pyrophosphate-binding protein [Actinomycetota bacterium]
MKVEDAPDSPLRDPQATSSERMWVSDILVDLLAELGIEYLTINPGASLRGLHDSLVNHAANGPRMLLCLHEDAAVAIAHGYAKATGEPMAVFLHANVGVLHGSMGVFNAFCDRVPMLVIGGNGPLDVEERRPWIDWIHTSGDLGAVLRGFVKWDAAPTTLRAAVDDVVAAVATTRGHPKAPVFVSVDRALQEESAPAGFTMPEVRRLRAAPSSEPADAAVDEAVGVLRVASRPVLMVGRVGRSGEDWDRRVRLAEALGAAVVTDFKTGAGFPTAHPLHVGVVAGLHLAPEAPAVLRQADAVVALDWIDLGSTLRQVFGSDEVRPRLVAAGMDAAVAGRWAQDGGAPAPGDVTLFCDPDVAVARLLPRLEGERPGWRRVAEPNAAVANAAEASEELRLADLITATRSALGDSPATLVRAPHRGWEHRRWEWAHPLDYLGYDGGAGLGSGPGMVVGAAIGLRGTGRLAVGVLGDGDYLQGCTALWTAAHERIPLLMVVANNGTYQTDEAHQELVARLRGRDPDLRWVGQRMSDPRLDLAGLARAQGAVGFGPVTTVPELRDAMDAGVTAARGGSSVVVDVHVGEY